MRIHTANLLSAILGLVVFTGCDPVKRVPEGRALLVKNTIHTKDKHLDLATMHGIIKQKPNKRILWQRFHLHVYNLPDPGKIPAWRAKKVANRDRRNARRVAHGRDPRPYEPTTAEWLREVVGEPPTILDSLLTVRSTTQLQLYLRKEGYFRAEVKDTLVVHDRRASVTYSVRAGAPYTIRGCYYAVDDEVMNEYYCEALGGRLYDPGQRFRADVLDEERNRITGLFKDLGYLYFNRDLVIFEVDTTVADRMVDITLKLERPLSRAARKLSGTPEGTIYSLDNVTVSTARRTGPEARLSIDTLHVDGYRLLYQGKRPEFKSHSLLSAVFLKPGSRYQQRNADLTYQRLANLKMFDRVDISYDTTGTGAPGRVNCRIDLIPSKRQSFSIEGFGTNSGGLLGVTGGLAHRHRNVFRSMASVTTQITIGLEAARSLTPQTEGSGGASTTVSEDVLFNTVEIGPEVNVRLPKALLVDRWFTRSSDPRTSIIALYNYQRRPDFTRTLGRVSFGWEWSESAANTVSLIPVDVSVVKLPKISDAFASYITSSNDPVLRDSYTDHFVVSIPRVTFTRNTQAVAKGPHVFFYRGTFDLAGTVLRSVDELVQAPLKVDSIAGDHFTLLGVRYAEFLKVDNDLRYFYTMHDKSSVAFRLAFGAAKPYGNLGVLPFASSFFVGGANGLRAWRARSVGPGSFSSPVLAYDRTGELRLEGNAEYRFKLIGLFEGAFFADAGNIWFWEEDALRPGSGFSGDFLSELAVGTGVGLRLNFDFFIIRFDLGLQTKDPALPAGERWIFQTKNSAQDTRFGQKLNFNLGIGYPF